jgi:predicted permease
VSVFATAFGEAFAALSQLAIIVGVSWFLRRKNLFSEEMISGMTRGVVYCFLPCLIFNKVSTGFDPIQMPFWWWIPLSALVMQAVGLGLTLLLNLGSFRKQPDLIPLGFMQNANFLSIAVGGVIAPGRFDEWAIYTFLYVLVFNPLLWSLGKYWISHDGKTPFQWKSLLTPPFIACIAGILSATSGLSVWVPDPVMAATGMLGSAAVPLSMIILGATLASTKIQIGSHGELISKSFVTKLLIMPAIVLVALLYIDLPPEMELLGLFWILQGAYPQASNMILQVRTWGGQLERLCAVLVVCYLGCFITLPTWVGIWRMLRAW